MRLYLIITLTSDRLTFIAQILRINTNHIHILFLLANIILRIANRHIYAETENLMHVIYFYVSFLQFCDFIFQMLYAFIYWIF